MSAGRSKVSLNPSRPLRAFPHEGTIIDESPALTAVLQAHPERIVAVGRVVRACPPELTRSSGVSGLCSERIPGDTSFQGPPHGWPRNGIFRCRGERLN